MSVKNVLKTIVVRLLQIEARLVLKKYKPYIITVTGTVGKTSTKDAVYTVLSKSYYVRKSEKSFNSEIGIPLTILACPTGWNNPVLWLKNIFRGAWLVLGKHDYPEILVLETSVGKPGDMSAITSWLTPDVVVFTEFSERPVHVEYFTSPKELFSEKTRLVDALKEDGLLVLNHDNDDVRELRKRHDGPTLTFGFHDNASVQIHAQPKVSYYRKKVRTPKGTSFKVQYGNSPIDVTILGSVGATHAYTIAAAMTIALHKEMPRDEVAKLVNSYTPPPGRLRIIPGVKQTTLIDDTYNSSPRATAIALHTLDDVKATGRKIAILGDMLELGKFSNEEHEKVGKEVKGVADILVTVGVRSKLTAHAAVEAGMPEKYVYEFTNSREAGKFVEQICEIGDVILVKGSQGMRMERAVQEIMFHPEQREQILVRQEKEWLAKK